MVRGTAASGTDTYRSDRFDGQAGFSLSVETTGTLTGTWTLWVSNKMRPDPSSDSDWSDISTHAEFVETNPAGSTTKWSVSCPSIRGRFFRLKYVNTSGTGTLYADATPAY